MLAKLYRYGPSPQRILRGFVIASSNNDCTAEQVAAATDSHSLGAIAGQMAKLCIDPDQPFAVSIDTGAIWLHNSETRRARFNELAEVTRKLARIVSNAGGVLLPSAIQQRPADDWSSCACADRHILVMQNDIEKELCVNLLRENSPTLVALTGRSGTNRNEVEPGGSRRLNDSSNCFSSRHVASVSNKYLKHLASELRRTEGVSSLAQLDVNPDVDGDALAVEIRFVDGQLLLANVRAHAILFQALGMAARRMVGRGDRIPGERHSGERFPGELIALAIDWEEETTQRDDAVRNTRIQAATQIELERNRERAVAQGLQAEFEFEPRLGAEGRELRIRSVPATEMVVRLFDQLHRELQALEVGYEEIAPLVLGATLREADNGAIQNENDLLRFLLESNSEWHGDFLRMVQRELLEPIGDIDPLTAQNQKMGKAAGWIATAWKSNLRVWPSHPSRPAAVDAGEGADL